MLKNSHIYEEELLSGSDDFLRTNQELRRKLNRYILAHLTQKWMGIFILLRMQTYQGPLQEDINMGVEHDEIHISSRLVSRT